MSARGALRMLRAMVTQAPKPSYWLVKSEPETFSFDDLWSAPRRTTGWDGVRNYQARNFLKAMRVGDGVLFYHSSADPTGVVGLAEVAAEAYPDPTQFDAQHAHHDPSSKRDDPRWFQVDVRATAKLERLVALEELRAEPALAGMELLRRGSRLSVQPVLPAHWDVVLRLAKPTAGARKRT